MTGAELADRVVTGAADGLADRGPQPGEAKGGAGVLAEEPLPPPVGIPGRGAGRVWLKGGSEGAGVDAAFTTLAELPCRPSLLPPPATSTEP